MTEKSIVEQAMNPTTGDLAASGREFPGLRDTGDSVTDSMDLLLARWEFWLLAAEGHFLRSRGSNESEPYFAGMEALKCAAMFRDLIHVLRESVN